jgi:hypothetical protein
MAQDGHNVRYAELQDEYLKSRSDAVLVKMYDVCREAAGNYIKKYARHKGLVFEDLEERAHDAAMYVISRHLKKPAFKVKRLSAYVHYGFLNVMFKGREHEQMETPLDESVVCMAADPLQAAAEEEPRAQAHERKVTAPEPERKPPRQYVLFPELEDPA